MVDFNKKIHNSDKFRLPAIFFLKHKKYCLAPYGTTEYMKYWDEEGERCLNGYTAEDGDWISGYNYFYLNYCPIQRLTEEEYTDRHGITKKRRVRDREFPDFYDYDYYYFTGILDAEDYGKHMVVLKARGRGYSFKSGSMLCRNYYLIPESISIAVASETEFLIRDGILTKAWEFMDFIDKNTAWTKKRLVDRMTLKRAGVIVTDEVGNKGEDGYKSLIMGITLKNNPDRIRGKRAKLIIWEESGKFKDILLAWQIARPGVEENDTAFGLMVAQGTGGSEGSDFDGLKKLFYHPNGYNVMSFPNIWDENSSDTLCAFFCPAYSNMSTIDEKTSKRLYMDNDGNSLVKKSITRLMEQRKEIVEGAADSVSVDRFIAENPITPLESCLEISGNIFPKKELLNQLSTIRTNKKLLSLKLVGDLTWVNGLLTWTQKKSGDITEYPLPKDARPEGSIVIWEHPMKNPPSGLYIAGCLTKGLKVITEDGLKNIEDVTLENKLVNKDGILVSINTLLRYEKLDEPTYRIKMSNIYRTTNFTQEHPLYVSNTFYNSNRTINENNFCFDFIKAKDIKLGMWTKYPNYYRLTKSYELPFDISDEDSLWHFIGVWLGDGWIDNNRICIAFNKNEVNSISRITSFIEDVLDRNPYIRTRNNCTEISFNHKELSNFLSITFKKGALNKRLPEWVKFIPQEYKMNLIQGYLDSDGCITRNSKYYSTEFVSISQELLEGFLDILFSIGIISNMTLMRDSKTSIIKGRKINQLPTWHLRLSHHSTLDLVKELPFTDDDKINRIDFQNLPIVRIRPKDGCFFNEDLQYIYIQIKSIKVDKYTGIVYNFDCDTHSFISPYCVGHNCDPYDHDLAGTNSLGSTFIWKRYCASETYSDFIVAEYTGRPATAEDYYENVRKLLMYYNAKLLYENERKGIYPYFTLKHCDYLLADQPDIINDIIKNSTVNRRKGIHMNKLIRQYGEGLIKEYLESEYDTGKMYLTRIFSEPLLLELIEDNGIRNVDRVIALCMVMIYREQLFNLKVKEAKDENKKLLMFELPLFSEAWWQQDETRNSQVGTPFIKF